nr:TetR/AcrR family transcriptional regulator [uncultured Methanospirillum sp.]
MPKVIPGYKDDAKRKIIQAAIDVIAERGFALTTIDEIATRLGVSKGAVYWYFPNKNALVKEVYTYIEEDFKRVHYKKYYNQSINKFLQVLFNKFSSNDYKLRRVFFEMVALAQRSTIEKNSLSKFLMDFIQTIKEIIEIEQKNHQLDDDIDPEIFAFLIVSQYLGIHLLSTLWLSQDKIDKIWDGFESHMFMKNQEDSKNFETSSKKK